MSNPSLNNPINQLDAHKISSLLENPAQTVLLGASRGFGINEYAQEIANLISNEVITIKGTLASGGIGVDDIEPVIGYSKHKLKNRIVIIFEDAHTMNPASQNKLLKLLEEPTKNVHYILSSEHCYDILPTIISRSQIFHLSKISDTQTDELLSRFDIIDNNKQSQIKVMASGLPLEIIKLSTEEDYFNQRSNQMSDAKIILQGSTYESIIVCNKYKESRPDSLRLIDDCLRLIEYLMTIKSVDNKMTSQIDKLILASENIQANGNVRINLLAVVV